MLATFKKFMADPDAWNMYITGPAGSGKTTGLSEGVEYCMANDIPYVVCAFTHKACDILRSKLPTGARVQTLHSFLTKRPSVNVNATNIKHLNSNVKSGTADEDPVVMFLDEYSMVGEKDNMDIVELQEPEGGEGEPDLRVVWIGDAHQIPPVGDMQSVEPEGDYQVKLNKIWRNDNPLQIPLNKLIAMIEGGDPTPLEEVPDYFIRGVDLAKTFAESKEIDKALLAYTNENVQSLNAEIAEADYPIVNEHEGSELFSPSTQKFYTFTSHVEPYDVASISIHYSEPLILGTKYKTLEHLIDQELCDFFEVINEDGEQEVFAVVFGHYNYKLKKEELQKAAVEANKAIESKHKGVAASAWARANKGSSLAKKRARAWRDFLCFNDCVVCMDWPHAMTIHKSQGSTFKEVYIDTDDVYKAAHRDFIMYARLLYVGISRASHKVYTN